MRYIEFRESIQNTLIQNPGGLTWVELKKETNLPYKTPCPTWVKQLEGEISLIREKGHGRALVWKLKTKEG